VKLLGTLLLILISLAPLALAQGGTYTKFDYPGAMATDALGVNQAGDIIGTYFDIDGFEHGFLLSGDVFTPIDYGSEFSATIASGINDLGQVVGYATGSGFIYDITTKSFTPYSYPGASDTYPAQINNTGSVVGLFRDGGDTAGFQCFGSECKQITPAGISAIVSGVTDSGAVFGTVEQPFKLAHGKYQRFRIPGEPEACVFGVNFAGTALVGWLPNSGQRAFLYEPGALTILEYPGAENTQAYGVNNNGLVVGAFVDALGVIHGFSWVPDAVPTN
jgi:uncharacterized membrane protein